MIGWIAYRSVRGMSREYGRSMRAFSAEPPAVKVRVIIAAVVCTIGLETSSWVWFAVSLAVWIAIEVIAVRIERQLDAIDAHRNTLTIGEHVDAR